MNAQQLTKELIAFASPSRSSNVDVSLFVAEKLRRLGFDVEQDRYTDASGVEKMNILGRRGPGESDKGLAYFCHSDVVPADDWTGPGEPFSGTVHGERLYGRGACDMKGSAACMLAAIERLKDAKLKAPLFFVCTADEEIGYLGARNLIDHSSIYRDMVSRQTRVLVGEPTELEVVYAHKGICKLEIISQGEAAHSSTREGRNANLAMIPFLQEVKQIHDETEQLDQWQNREFDPPTLSWNIGINDHTAAVNVKPARSVCTIFFRPLPGVDDQPLIARAAAAARTHGLEVTIYGRCEAVYTDPGSPFVRQTLQLAETESARTVSYGTDAGVLTELEDKIILGPGSISQAHTTDEWIQLSQLDRGCELYEKLVRRWCV